MISIVDTVVDWRKSFLIFILHYWLHAQILRPKNISIYLTCDIFDERFARDFRAVADSDYREFQIPFSRFRSSIHSILSDTHFSS